MLLSVTSAKWVGRIKPSDIAHDKAEIPTCEVQGRTAAYRDRDFCPVVHIYLPFPFPQRPSLSSGSPAPPGSLPHPLPVRVRFPGYIPSSVSFLPGNLTPIAQPAKRSTFLGPGLHPSSSLQIENA